VVLHVVNGHFPQEALVNQTTHRGSFWVAKLLIEVVFELRFLCKTTRRSCFWVEIFMQSLILKYNLTVKVLAIFIQQVNMKSSLNGYR
jgi:hypothetical protein